MIIGNANVFLIHSNFCVTELCNRLARTMKKHFQTAAFANLLLVSQGDIKHHWMSWPINHITDRQTNKQINLNKLIK